MGTGLRVDLDCQRAKAIPALVLMSGDLDRSLVGRARLRSLCRVEGANPLLARRRSVSVCIHQGNDHGERFRIEGGDVSAPELALLVDQRRQYAGQQTGLRKCRVLLDPSHHGSQRIPDWKLRTKTRDAPQFFLKPGCRQQLGRPRRKFQPGALPAHVGSHAEAIGNQVADGQASGRARQHDNQ